MKNLQIILHGVSVAFSASLLLCAASCSDVESSGSSYPSPGMSALGVNPVIVSDTGLKSALSGTSFPAGSEIGLFYVGDDSDMAVSYYGNPSTFYDTYSQYYFVYPNYVSYYSNSDLFRNVKISRGGGSWTMDRTIYPCPGPGFPIFADVDYGSATVFGYYPYDENVTDFHSVPVSSSIDGTDFMCAVPVDGITMGNPNVLLTFRHSLAIVNLDFRVFGFGDRSNLAVSDLKIYGDGFSLSGTLDAATGSIAANASDLPAEGSPLTSADTYPLDGSGVVTDCLLVPLNDGNESSRRSLHVSCMFNGTERKVNLTGANGVMIRGGYRSTVRLNIRDTSSIMTVDDITVTEWNGASVSGDSAQLDEHTVTFDFTDESVSGLPHEISYKQKDVDVCYSEFNVAPAGKALKLVCDYSFIPMGKFLSVSITPANACRCTTDYSTGDITVSDVTADVTLKFFLTELRPIGFDAEIQETEN